MGRSKYKDMIGEVLAEKKAIEKDMKRLQKIIKEKDTELADKEKLIETNSEKYLDLAERYSTVANKNKKLKEGIGKTNIEVHKRTVELKRRLDISERMCQDYYRDNIQLKDRITDMDIEIKLLRKMLDSKALNYIIKVCKSICRKLRKKSA